MRRLLVAASALLLAAGFGLTAANAASLEVSTATGTFVTEELPCSAGTVNGVPVIGAAAADPGSPGMFGAVSLSSIPTKCQGLPADVFVHTTAGGLISTGSGAVGSDAIGVGDYTGSAVTAVVVRIDGWLFPTDWTAPEAPTPPLVSNCVVYSMLAGVSGPCEVTFTVGPVLTSPLGQYQELTINVDHSIPQQLYWTADFNFAELPGLLVEPTRLGADWANASAPAGCEAFPVVTLRSSDHQFTVAMYIGEYPTWRPDICS